MTAIKNLIGTFLLLCLISISHADGNNNGKLQIHPWFAAKCISLSDSCGGFYEKYTGSRCEKGLKWYKQRTECIKYACEWCEEWKARSMRQPCGSNRVLRACAKLNEINEEDEEEEEGEGEPEDSPPPMESSTSSPMMSPTSSPMVSPVPSPMASPSTVPISSPSTVPMEPEKIDEESEPKNGMCVWRGKDDNVVIDLGTVPLVEGWDRVTRDGYKGIIFSRSPARGISPKGMYGKMCFDVKAPMDGKYYLTAISYAPHNTEHNDVWVSTSKGFELWQSGDMRTTIKPNEWLKAYQNNGIKGMSEHFKTIDHDGHRFLVPGVMAGETFQVCLAGRSKKYEMYHLVLKKCEDMYCRGGIMKGDMIFDLKPSECI